MKINNPFPIEIDELMAQMAAFEEANTKACMGPAQRNHGFLLQGTWSQAYVSQEVSSRFVGWVMASHASGRSALPEPGSARDLLRWLKKYESVLSSSLLAMEASKTDAEILEDCRGMLEALRETIKVAESGATASH
jgi:hypothetical protein